MSKIESLTEEQISKFPEYVKKWTDIGLCTEPANRPEAEKAIHLCYKKAGLKPPEKIVWSGSPLSQGLVRFFLKEIDKKIAEQKIGDAVWSSVLNAVRDAVSDPVSDAVWSSVSDAVRDPVLNAVRDPILNAVWVAIRDPASDAVWVPVWDAVWVAIRQPASDAVRDAVRHAVLNAARDPVLSAIRTSIWDSLYSYHSAFMCAFYDFVRIELNLIEQTDKITGLMELAKHCGWIIPYENICFASERHCVLNRDKRGRLHCLTGPAVKYPDGWEIYAVHGVRVLPYIINTPSEITVEKIDQEQNIEIRRVMIDIYGTQKYLLDSNAELIDASPYGKLYKKEVKDDEPIVMVNVIDATPQPNGISKEYFPRVPPNITTAHEAVAWTFQETEQSYQPIIET